MVPSTIAKTIGTSVTAASFTGRFQSRQFASTLISADHREVDSSANAARPSPGSVDTMGVAGFKTAPHFGMRKR